MDPITGTELAASVVQLVTFSLDAVRVCKELYQKGSVSEYSKIDYTTGRLASSAQSLQQSLQSSSSHSHALTKEERNLLDLARKCEDCAQRLQAELQKLRMKRRTSALETLQKAARAFVKGHTIRKIQEELEKCKSTLETSLLIDLR